MIAHVQSSFDVACGDNLRSGRAQSRLQIERDKKLASTMRTSRPASGVVCIMTPNARRNEAYWHKKAKS